MSRSSLPPELEALLRAIEAEGPLDSPEDATRVFAAGIEAYNTRPQEELGGLSPVQMYDLLNGDWHGQGALRLNETLPIDDLVGAPLLADARVVLEYVAANGVVKETTAGNLPRAAVAALLPLLRAPARSRAELAQPEPRAANEGDVTWLQALRYTLMLAGLLVRRKGLRVSTRGKDLLRPARAGELYAVIFRTMFREMDLRFFDRSDRHQGLQATIAYSFYRLSSLAGDWTSAEALAGEAWLKDAREPPSESDLRYGDLRHYSFRHRVLHPLSQFGLLEERHLPTEERWRTLVEFRVTPLFSRFLKFEW